MFQLKWANKSIWSPDTDLEIKPSQISSADIASIMKLVWEEHCVECAVPECYQHCVLYQARKDGACARFVYGITPDKRFKGHYNFGADVTFRKWGKLEACLADTYPAGKKEQAPYKLATHAFDEFVIECYSPLEASYKLICEYFTENSRVRNTKFRHAFNISRGHNFFSIPFSLLNISSYEGYIYLYPENSDKDTRLIFTWLDFIKYKKRTLQAKAVPPKKTAVKVKCVAWDLDNTFWHGTLIEQESVEAKPDAIELVKKLDEKGIIQTIISKNDFDPCWEKLKKLQMDQYFLMPAINWDQKSQNICKIVEKLNINLDSVAVIDDSPFERAEISSALPQVRVYSEKEIGNILNYEEFDVIISEESRERRNKYRKEIERIDERENFAGSYEDFLISCKMEAEAFIPDTENNIERCFELVQRSNQLNLSTIRYSRDQYRELLLNRKVLSIAIRCQDKFGDYGIVGFSSINVSGGAPLMENFVLSCRVAQKRVEHAYMKAITELLHTSGYNELWVKLVLTPKNGPLCKVFADFPFSIREASNDIKTMSIPTDALINTSSVLKFTLRDSVSNFRF